MRTYQTESSAFLPSMPACILQYRVMNALFLKEYCTETQNKLLNISICSEQQEVS